MRVSQTLLRTPKHDPCHVLVLFRALILFLLAPDRWLSGRRLGVERGD